MGREVSNYLVMKSNKLDVNKLLKDYLDRIFSIDDEDPSYMMVYGEDLNDTRMIDLLGKDNFREVRNRKYYFNGETLIFYAETRKCDLLESFEEFIEPHVKNLDSCKLFMRDVEAGDDLSEKDFITDRCKYYYGSDLPDSFYFDDYGEEEFIFGRCGIALNVYSILLNPTEDYWSNVDKDVRDINCKRR